MATTTEKQVERIEVLVQDLHARNAHDKLPNNVFPVKIGVTMERTQSKDLVFRGIRPPEYPVKVQKSTTLPYISSRVVYFENPAEISSQGKKRWTYRSFVEQLNQLLKWVEEADPSASERLYLNQVTIVEVPEEYARIDCDDCGRLYTISQSKCPECGHKFGSRAVDKSLYEDRAEMTIGHFTKRPTISEDEIREKLGGALPNEVKQPLRLTQIKEVNAKSYRGTNETTAASTKRRYFTEGQAEQYNDIGLSPSIWKLVEDGDSENGSFRPLSLALDDIERFFPTLSESPFLQKVKFYGRMDQSERFIEEDAVIL